MKTPTPSQLFTIVCAAVLSGCANPPLLTKVPVSSVAHPADHVLTARLYQEVNSYRRRQGAKDLQRHAGLDRLAQEHCEYLRQHRGTFTLNGKNVSHIGSDGRAIVARTRYHMFNISENVAAAPRAAANPASALIRLWTDSRDHHKNMLDAWTYTGVGLVVDADGMAFGTQLFATTNDSQMATRERFNRF